MTYKIEDISNSMALIEADKASADGAGQWAVADVESIRMHGLQARIFWHWAGCFWRPALEENLQCLACDDAGDLLSGSIPLSVFRDQICRRDCGNDAAAAALAARIFELTADWESRGANVVQIFGYRLPAAVARRA